MPLSPLEPIIIPAKTYDKLWVKQIQIFAPHPGKEVTARILMVPSTSDNEILEGKEIAINVEGIMEKSIDQTSNIAKAMFFLLAAIDEEYKAQNTQESL